MNRGGLGARSLNIELQNALNPPGEIRNERFGRTFCPGDKVMQVENDYDKEVYNGDLGVVSGIDMEEGELSVDFDGRDVNYGFAELDELVLAYATTIHKSQGSEYPAVVIPLTTQHYPMLQRNLVYTGVTRGKRLAVLVGQRKALAIAVKGARTRRRWSKLREWLGIYVVIPIMAGGVGEGAIPLSIGYAEILHQEQGNLFALILPPIMLGSLTAILLAGFLNWVGKRLPRLTGEGRLQPGVGEELTPGEEKAAASAVDPGAIAAAGVTAIALYLLGMACFKLFGLPGPVAMLFLAVLVKLTRAVPPSLQLAGQTVYKFFSTAVTYPLLFAIGVSLTPWETLVAALTPANIAVIVVTVATLMATGFVVGRLLGMFPIETAIVNACHSGQGGTGDIAILTAANRLELMPFAQIATRIGGAITVTLTLIFLARLA